MQSRNDVWVCLLVAAGLGTYVSRSEGQEPAPQASIAVKDRDLAADSPLAAIPVNLLSKVIHTDSETKALGISPQQRHDLQAFINESFMQMQPFNSLRSDLNQAKLNNHRFELVIAEMLDATEVAHRRRAQPFLTFEQRAQIRQKHRQELAQLSMHTSLPHLSPYFSTPIESYLASDDLLSALLQPDVQQSVQLTDDQWLQVDAARKEAYPAAQALIAKIAKSYTPKTLADTPQRSVLVEELNRNSVALLTPDQAERYEALLKERKNRVSAATEQNNLADVLKYSLLHGSPSPIQAQLPDGVRTSRIVPYNLFAEPDFIQILALTVPQQEALAKLVTDTERAIQQAHNEYQSSQFARGPERQQQLRELILPHNRQFQARLKSLLTPLQNEELQKIKWRGLGLPALMRTEIAERLGLTDQQKSAIDAQFKLPPPQLKPSTNPGDFEEFRKNSDEYQKKSREHHASVTANVWAQLTPEQVEKFDKLTGLRPPAPPKQSAPAAPAGK